MDEPLDPVLFTGFQQMFRAANVRLLVDSPRLASKLKGCAKMNDRVAAWYCRSDTRVIAKVSTHDPNPVAKEALRLLRCAAEDAHARASGEQPAHHVASDKSRTTRDQELPRRKHCGRIYVKHERQRSVFHCG